MRTIRVVVEVPRGTRVKWGSDGSIDFVSPFACPFNYGSAPDLPAPDGDPQDVVLLGPPVQRGAERTVTVRARVRFVDDGVADDKWICADQTLSPAETRRVARFFRLYAAIKRPLNRLRGKTGPTRYDGIEHLTQPED
jgi:inorganic pyrophosphatase